MILSIASIIIAAALVLVTFLYMRHTKRLAEDTKRMADIMAQEFELKIAPIIQIEKRDAHFQGNFGSTNFEIINKGSLPVHIVKIVLEWWHREEPDRIYKNEVEIDKVLAGGEPKKFTIQSNKGDMLKGAFEKSKDRSLWELRGLTKGKIYAIYKDRNENEYKTRDFLLECPF